MAPPNGTYLIVSVGSSYAVNLTFGAEYGALTGNTPANPGRHWILKNVDDNKITLQNVIEGYYASTFIYQRAVPLWGTRNPTFWTLQHVKDDIYQITVDDFLWRLSADALNASIFLDIPGSGYSPELMQWRFQPLE